MKQTVIFKFLFLMLLPLLGVSQQDSIYNLSLNQALDLAIHNNIDITVAEYVTDSVAAFLNNGDGTYQQPIHFGAGKAPVGFAPTPADGR